MAGVLFVDYSALLTIASSAGAFGNLSSYSIAQQNSIVQSAVTRLNEFFNAYEITSGLSQIGLTDVIQNDISSGSSSQIAASAIQSWIAHRNDVTMFTTAAGSQIGTGQIDLDQESIADAVSNLASGSVATVLTDTTTYSWLPTVQTASTIEALNASFYANQISSDEYAVFRDGLIAGGQEEPITDSSLLLSDSALGVTPGINAQGQLVYDDPNATALTTAPIVLTPAGELPNFFVSQEIEGLTNALVAAGVPSSEYGPNIAKLKSLAKITGAAGNIGALVDGINAMQLAISDIQNGDTASAYLQLTKWSGEVFLADSEAAAGTQISLLFFRGLLGRFGLVGDAVAGLLASFTGPYWTAGTAKSQADAINNLLTEFVNANAAANSAATGYGVISNGVYSEGANSSNGGSVDTVFQPDSSSVSDYYNGTNGSGSVQSVDVEDASGGTSKLITFNANGSQETKSFNSLQLSGKLTDDFILNTDGSWNDIQYLYSSKGVLEQTTTLSYSETGTVVTEYNTPTLVTYEVVDGNPEVVKILSSAEQSLTIEGPISSIFVIYDGNVSTFSGLGNLFADSVDIASGTSLTLGAYDDLINGTLSVLPQSTLVVTDTINPYGIKQAPEFFSSYIYVEDQSYLEIDTPNSSTPDIFISDGATVVFGSSVEGSTVLSFDPFEAQGSGTLKIDHTAEFLGSVGNFLPGSVIDLADVSGVVSYSYGLNSHYGKTFPGSGQIEDLLTINAINGQTYQIALQAGYEDVAAAGTYGIENFGQFIFTPDGTGGTDITDVACYVKGTHIATAVGETKVEDLEIGDHVETLDGRLQRIKWIGKRSYDGRFIAGNKDILPIRIAKGAICVEIPSRDLIVSPGHAICIDGALIHAFRLVNCVSITQADSVESITYYHIETENHEVIFAENCPAETFLDENFRAQFQNAANYRALYPGQSAASITCLPLLEDGLQLHAIQQRLNARAGIAPAPETHGALRGYVDEPGPIFWSGWAQDVENPETPVCLDILIDDTCVARVLANSYRADLRQAGLGSGCHAFRAMLPAGLTGRVEIRRATDGAELRWTEAALAHAA